MKIAVMLHSCIILTCRVLGQSVSVIIIVRTYIFSPYLSHVRFSVAVK